MKGRSTTKAQRKFWNDLCETVGCIACRKEGRINTWVSVHHIDGRTKPHAHWYVLPLCGSHHQSMGDGVIAVHPNKARFEETYGRQIDLFAECLNMLAEVPQEALDVLGKKKAVYS